jgi:hypothetical protein
MSNTISILIAVLVFIIAPFWLVYKLDGGLKLFAIALSFISAGVFVVILVSVNEIEIAFLVLAFALLGYGILAVQSLKLRRADRLRPGHRLDKRRESPHFNWKPTSGKELLPFALGEIFACVFFILYGAFNEVYIVLLILALALLGYGIYAGRLLNKLQLQSGYPSHVRGFWTESAIETLNQRADERFSEYKDRILRSAGWFPERHVLSTLVLPDGFDPLEPARLVLDEFGGLSLNFVYTMEYGEKLSKRNQSASLVIDPALCAEEIEKESISEHSQVIGHPLYPLGVYYDVSYSDPDCSTILIDDLGRLFLIAFPTDTFLGETFEIALDNLLAGGKGKSMDEVVPNYWAKYEQGQRPEI